MTLEKAQARLTELRSQQTEIKKEIETLKDFIYKKGGDPNFHLQNFADRNKAMYHEWKSGSTFSQVAKKNCLSASRVQGICRRIDADIKHKRGNYRFYLLDKLLTKQTCYPPSMTVNANVPSCLWCNASSH